MVASYPPVELAGYYRLSLRDMPAFNKPIPKHS
jgi:hypothetical protein